MNRAQKKLMYMYMYDVQNIHGSLVNAVRCVMHM